jgi:hypothetical protein
MKETLTLAEEYAQNTAIEFFKFVLNNCDISHTGLPWVYYQGECKTTEEMFEIYKKENGL